LTIMGVALGVAVLVAIDLANESAVASFRQSVDDVAGQAELTVRGNGMGLPGTTIAELGSLPAVAAVEPLISGPVLLPATVDGASTMTLTIFGVDLLRSERTTARAVRSLQFQPIAEAGRTSLLSDPAAVVVPRRLLEKRNLRPGDPLTVLVRGEVRTLRIMGVLTGESFADSLDGGFAVMDIAMADHLLGRGGLIDRLDLLLEEGQTADGTRESLIAGTNRSLVVERPDARSERAAGMIAAFRFNLAALGHISILVGAFLVYNTMSVAVVRRRPAIGTVRALGVGPLAVGLVFLGEALLLGVLACLIGVPAGIAMALLMLESVSTAISINFFAAEGTRLFLAPATLITALTVGLGGSLIAALRPAYEAAVTPPANTMRRGGEESASSGVMVLLVAGVLALIIAAALLQRPVQSGLPITGYAASVFLVGAFVLWSKPLLLLVSRVLRRLYASLFGAQGLLAVAGVQAMPGRASIALCGLLISLGMTVSVTVMVSSFRTTVVTWMEQILRADFYLSAAADGASPQPPPVPATLLDELATIPGVRSVESFRRRTFEWRGRTVNLGATNLPTAQFGDYLVDGRPREATLREVQARGEVAISEAFGRKNGVGLGDSVEIPTPAGDRTFRIGAVYYDYSSEQGFVVMDRALYLELYNDPLIDSLAIYVKEGVDRGIVRTELEARLAVDGDLPPMQLRANGDLRAFALEAFDQTFAITSILKVIAVLVSILGVAATLLAQLLDRRQEIQTLRTIGVSIRRISGIVVLEASLIALGGVLLGTVAGIGLSWILSTRIMMESFGWTIGWSVPWGEVAQAGAIVYVFTVLSAFIPAWQVTRSGSGTTAQLSR
jgi:putative ABC transport system permease protein